MTLRGAFGFTRSIAVYRLNVIGQLRMRRLYRQFVQPGDLAFDVGAHVGDRVWALRALGCRVVAFEPQAEMMKFLRRIYGRAENVSLEDCALGAKRGNQEMLISTGNPTLSSLSQEWTERAGRTSGFSHVAWDARQDVRIETLDDMIARHGLPQFCKIDVEGFEREVLAGLSQPIPSLSFEFLGAQPALASACIDKLAQLGGYEFNISYREDKKLRLTNWVSKNEITDHIHNLPKRARSGDVYARVQKEEG